MNGRSDRNIIRLIMFTFDIGLTTSLFALAGLFTVSSDGLLFEEANPTPVAVGSNDAC